VHTWARDTTVSSIANLNPGIPILIIVLAGDVSLFGAVLTVLPDSSLVVLRAIENYNPLGLQPGDLSVRL